MYVVYNLNSFVLVCMELWDLFGYISIVCISIGLIIVCIFMCSSRYFLRDLNCFIFIIMNKFYWMFI